jgi:serine/threonine protein kinase
MNAFNDRDGFPFYALREIKLLQCLNNTYKADSKTVQMLDCFYVEADKTVCIVMELLSGSSLYDLVRTGRQLSRYDHVAWSSDEEENK